MKETFVINWVDPISNAVSVTYSSLPDTPWSVPVDKAYPDSWQQAISDWYAANLLVVAPVPAPAGALALLPAQDSAPAE